MGTKPQTAAEFFAKSQSLAKNGQKQAARKHLWRALEREPENETFWLYLAGIAASPAEARSALDNVARLTPNHPLLGKARTWVERTWPQPAPAETPPPAKPAQPQRHRILRLAMMAALAAVVTLIVAGLLSSGATANLLASVRATPTPTTAELLDGLRGQLAAAEANHDQPAQLAALEQMLALSPNDSAIAADLSARYFEQGMNLRNGGNFHEAQAVFSRTLAIDPDFEAAQSEQSLVETYLDGVKNHQQANWAQAIADFETVYAQNPAYPYVDEILYSSYYNFGLLQMNQNNLPAALDAFERAAEVLPTGPEAPQKIAEVQFLLTPPTPTPTATPAPLPTATPTPPPARPQKRVVVDISEQRTYVYEGDTLVYTFIVSTGEPGRDTAVGNFQILDKIPMAYASTWNLDMPYWLGIYWSGPLENGFHALPTVRHTGYTLWDGYLGQRVSFGCIILSYADAKTLYDWVDIGTPVTVQW